MAIRSIEPAGTDRNGAVLERRGEILSYDEAGEGPALVLVHGFPFDRRLWAGQLRSRSNIRPRQSERVLMCSVICSDDEFVDMSIVSR